MCATLEGDHAELLEALERLADGAACHAVCGTELLFGWETITHGVGAICDLGEQGRGQQLMTGCRHGRHVIGDPKPARVLARR